MNIISKLRSVNRARNLKIKKIKIKIKIFMMYLLYRNKTELLNKDYKNICLFMHSQAIGDALVSSGIIHNLREAGFKVFVIIPSRISFMFANIIKADGVVYAEKNNNKMKHKLDELKIDLVIDLSDFDASVLNRLKTLFYIKPQHAIGFNQPAKTIFDTNIITKTPEHITKRMESVLDLLDINKACKPHISFSESKLAEASLFVNSICKADDKLIIFNPFASQKNRNLSQEQINVAISFLSSLKNYKTIVFNLGKDIEVGDSNNIYLNPFNDAETSFAIVNYADIVITVDTAIVHLAAALDKRQFCIYNNRLCNGLFDNNIVWGPNNDNATLLTTNQFLNTEDGDSMALFDMSILIDAIKKEIK